MSTRAKIRVFFANGGSGTNSELARKFRTSKVLIRTHVCALRKEGMEIGKVLPADTLKAVYQLSADFTTAKRGRPAYSQAVV
jgi:predicted ArsR family transcriptional regulator